MAARRGEIMYQGALAGPAQGEAQPDGAVLSDKLGAKRLGLRRRRDYFSGWRPKPQEKEALNFSFPPKRTP